MISDFLILDDINIVDKVSCHCFLPDPDWDDEDSIVQCGSIEYDENRDKLSIVLFDNFKDLCIGDTYNRKDFVISVIYNLKSKGVNVYTANLNIDLLDSWGKYVDIYPPTDNTIRE